MSQKMYQKMYAVLCGAVSDAIDALQDPGNGLYTQCLLEKAMLRTEEIYINWEEAEDVEKKS